VKELIRSSHQAALGSVPRSIENPMQSTEVNILGTVNLMYAAVQQKVERIILAFSSSTYGDHPDLPKVEEHIGNSIKSLCGHKGGHRAICGCFWENLWTKLDRASIF
jgi:UDP-glucose 4-epimerase